MRHRYLVRFEPGEIEHIEADVVIVGSGIAGMFAAHTLAAAGVKVALLAKGGVSDSNTYHAQGGIAAALGEFDSPQLHFNDTMACGAGLCNPQAVRVLVEEGPARVRELMELGVRFDRNGGGLAFTREGAHSRKRVVHARGDATGREVAEALMHSTSHLENVKWFQDTFTIDVLTVGGRACGVLARRPDGRMVIFAGRAVILATGGLGALFEHTTNPDSATGDGMAMAYRAGADLVDMEFIQFHPTVLDLEGAPRFLISEAVRGEGAILVNERGERFMPRYHPLGELAPRDAVVRAMTEEMNASGGGRIFLDMTPLGRRRIEERFPLIYRTCLEYGLDVTLEAIPVSPAAHYSMGGISIDLWGKTTIPGLFACGEAASNGVHGANRLASNSLLDGLVFAKRAALKAAEFVADVPSCDLRAIDGRGDAPGRACSPGESAGSFRSALRRAMMMGAGVVRNERGLLSARERLHSLAFALDVEGSDPSWFELQNMLTIADVITKAALTRTESRGGHFREDFPEASDERWLVHLTWNVSGDA